MQYDHQIEMVNPSMSLGRRNVTITISYTLITSAAFSQSSPISGSLPFAAATFPLSHKSIHLLGQLYTDQISTQSTDAIL